MSWLRRIPVFIAVLIALDVALVLAPMIDFWLGSPYAIVRNTLNLDSEHSLPAWYSSIQWFCVGALFGVLAIGAFMSNFKKLPPGFATMAIFSLVCIAFSADEIVGIHEWLGLRSDALLPGGDRANISLWRTGVWPLLIGMPVVVIFVYMVMRMRRVFAPSPRALRLFIGGLALMFAGALLLELAANLIATPKESRGLVMLQVGAEEFLEMLGVSVLAWSALDLLRAYGVELRAPSFSGAVAESPSRTGYRANSAHGRTMFSG